MFILEEDIYPDEQAGADFSPPPAIWEMDAEQKREYWASLALRHCPGLGSRGRTRLLKHYGSAFAALRDSHGWLEHKLRHGVIDEIKKETWRPGARKEWDEAGIVNAGIILWNDARYPRRLRQLPDAPCILYARGDASLLHGPIIAIVGSRNATAHGLEFAAYLGKSISLSGITVVSGMALGIDRQAHGAALQEVGKSIGVLGTGIDLQYPASNRDLYGKMEANGLLLSEFAPKTPPKSANFPVRNRIISGLSLAVVVVEAAEHSGSLITARLALEQNRGVFAVPGLALDQRSLGCQNLVRQGACPVFGVEDILRDLADELKSFQIKISPGHDLSGPSAAVRPVPERSGHTGNDTGRQCSRTLSESAGKAAQYLVSDDNFSKISACLLANGIMNIDCLAQTLEMPVSVLNSTLVGLEMLGKIRRLPGSRVEALR